MVGSKKNKYQHLNAIRKKFFFCFNIFAVVVFLCDIFYIYIHIYFLTADMFFCWNLSLVSLILKGSIFTFIFSFKNIVHFYFFEFLLGSVFYLKFCVVFCNYILCFSYVLFFLNIFLVIFIPLFKTKCKHFYITSGCC